MGQEHEPLPKLLEGIPLSKETELILQSAQYDAEKYGQSSISPEVLLYSICTKGSIGSETLNSLHIPAYIVEQRINSTLHAANRVEPTEDIVRNKFRLKEIITMADSFRRISGDDDLTPKHIVQAIILREDGVIKNILHTENLSYEELRSKVRSQVESQEN